MIESVERSVEFKAAVAALVETCVTGGNLRNFNTPLVGRRLPQPSMHMDGRMQLTLTDMIKYYDPPLVKVVVQPTPFRSGNVMGTCDD